MTEQEQQAVQESARRMRERLSGMMERIASMEKEVGGDAPAPAAPDVAIEELAPAIAKFHASLRDAQEARKAAFAVGERDLADHMELLKALEAQSEKRAEARAQEAPEDDGAWKEALAALQEQVAAIGTLLHERTEDAAFLQTATQHLATKDDVEAAVKQAATNDAATKDVATKSDVQAATKNVATKSDVQAAAKDMATKADVQAATKDMATKADVQAAAKDMATKADVQAAAKDVATKSDVQAATKDVATKADVQAVTAELQQALGAQDSAQLGEIAHSVGKISGIMEDLIRAYEGQSNVLAELDNLLHADEQTHRQFYEKAKGVSFSTAERLQLGQKLRDVYDAMNHFLHFYIAVRKLVDTYHKNAGV